MRTTAVWNILRATFGHCLATGTGETAPATEVELLRTGLQPLFEFKIDGMSDKRAVIGSLRSTGLRPTFLDKFEKRDIKLPAGLFQMQNGHANGHVPPVPARVGNAR